MSVQAGNGTMTIPVAVRRMFGLDKPGSQVEVIVRDSEIVLVPHNAVRADGKEPARRERLPWDDIPTLRVPPRWPPGPDGAVESDD